MAVHFTHQWKDACVSLENQILSGAAASTINLEMSNHPVVFITLPRHTLKM